MRKSRELSKAGEILLIFIWAVANAAPWTIACQAPLSRDFSLASGLPLPTSGIFQAEGSIPHILHLLHWQLDSLPPASPGKPQDGCMKMKMKLLNHVQLCDPMDCSLPGSSVHGIFQARVLEWGAIVFSRGSSQPRDQTWVSHITADALPSEPPGKPRWVYMFVKTHRNVLLRSVHFTFAKFTCLKRITTDSCSQEKDTNEIP